MKTLRMHRKEEKMSLDELGRRAQVERSRLSRAERGYIVLHDEEIARVAAVFGVKRLAISAG